MSEGSLYKDEVFKIIGCAMEVYNELGNGFLEAVYHEAIEIEFNKNKIPFKSKEKLKINYKGRELEKTYEADIIVYDKILVEL